MKVSCPTCAKTLNVPDSLAGKRVKCPGCGGVLELPSAPAEAASEPAAPPAPAPAPARSRSSAAPRPAGTGRGATRPRPSRLRTADAEGAGPGEPKKPFWHRFKWVGYIVLIIGIGWVVVALDSKHQEDMAGICRGRAEQVFVAGAKEPELVRFLVNELDQDCLSAAQVEERVTRRSKRWTYDVDKYLATMQQRLDREMSNPNSALVKRYRTQGR
jgi:hypothetical protein